MKMKNNSLVVLLAIFLSATVYADAPIEDQSSSANIINSNVESNIPVATPHLSLEQRVARLENQITNLNQANFQSHLDSLEQQVQKLNGDLEVQTQDLKDLKDEVNNFYKDLDQRIKQKSPDQSVETTKNTSEDATSTKDKTAKTTYKAATDNSIQEQKAYQAALDLLQTQKFDAGAKKLRAYIKNYPEGAFVANAHYWLGEVYFTQQKNKQAEAEFNIIISKFKTFKKLPDAMLKVAMLHDKAGKHAQAQREFNLIKKQFPKTPAAKLAEEQLKAINN